MLWLRWVRLHLNQRSWRWISNGHAHRLQLALDRVIFVDGVVPSKDRCLFVLVVSEPGGYYCMHLVSIQIVRTGSKCPRQAKLALNSLARLAELLVLIC